MEALLWFSMAATIDSGGSRRHPPEDPVRRGRRTMRGRAASS
jgi:hypothetical protein